MVFAALDRPSSGDKHASRSNPTAWRWPRPGNESGCRSSAATLGRFVRSRTCGTVRPGLGRLCRGCHAPRDHAPGRRKQRFARAMDHNRERQAQLMKRHQCYRINGFVVRVNRYERLDSVKSTAEDAGALRCPCRFCGFRRLSDGARTPFAAPSWSFLEFPAWAAAAQQPGGQTPTGEPSFQHIAERRERIQRWREATIRRGLHHGLDHLRLADADPQRRGAELPRLLGQTHRGKPSQGHQRP